MIINITKKHIDHATQLFIVASTKKDWFYYSPISYALREQFYGKTVSLSKSGELLMLGSKLYAVSSDLRQYGQDWVDHKWNKIIPKSFTLR